jgi:hypothetical protein
MQYICETCETTVELTEQEAYEAGWDYPPFIGIWGVVSPRTCPNCTIETTAYWHLITKGGDDLPERHVNTIKRILAEPLATTLEGKFSPQ